MYRGAGTPKNDIYRKIYFVSAVVEKRKSAAQNRTKTTNCPNSVSYGAWKIFSPYGSCSACTIRNRSALFGFQSISASSAFDNTIIWHTLPKRQELYFPLRMRVRMFGLALKIDVQRADFALCIYYTRAQIHG